MEPNIGVMEQNSFKNDYLNPCSDTENKPHILKFREKSLDLSAKTHIMGVLNVTPDSFSDGNSFKTVDQYLRRIEEMISQGADIIDIGAESTRPGSEPVSVDEELDRLLPLLEKALGSFETIFSVDTTKSEVAKQSLECGASIINDISGLNFDPEIGRYVAEHGAAIVLMHTSGRPDIMQDKTIYDSIMRDIYSSLSDSIAKAVEYGININSIVVDPGIGFGKTVEQNLEIIRNLSELNGLNRPILIGTSRKSFIGKLLDGAGVHNRVEGTAATVTASIMNGASIVRVHDIAEMKKIVKITDAINGRN